MVNRQAKNNYVSSNFDFRYFNPYPEDTNIERLKQSIEIEPNKMSDVEHETGFDSNHMVGS